MSDVLLEWPMRASTVAYTDFHGLKRLVYFGRDMVTDGKMVDLNPEPALLDRVITNYDFEFACVMGAKLREAAVCVAGLVVHENSGAFKIVVVKLESGCNVFFRRIYYDYFVGKYGVVSFSEVDLGQRPPLAVRCGIEIVGYVMPIVLGEVSFRSEIDCAMVCLLRKMQAESCSLI